MITPTTGKNKLHLRLVLSPTAFADRFHLRLVLSPTAFRRSIQWYLGTPTTGKTFISFLFILLECLPFFVKLMSDKSPYDIALQNVEAVSIYKSERYKDHKFIVIDNVLETRNDAVTGKKKILIKRKVDKDLEEDV